MIKIDIVNKKHYSYWNHVNALNICMEKHIWNWVKQVPRRRLKMFSITLGCGVWHKNYSWLYYACKLNWNMLSFLLCGVCVRSAEQVEIHRKMWNNEWNSLGCVWCGMWGETTPVEMLLCSSMSNEHWAMLIRSKMSLLLRKVGFYLKKKKKK